MLKQTERKVQVIISKIFFLIEINTHKIDERYSNTKAYYNPT